MCASWFTSAAAAAAAPELATQTPSNSSAPAKGSEVGAKEKEAKPAQDSLSLSAESAKVFLAADRKTIRNALIAVHVKSGKLKGVSSGTKGMASYRGVCHGTTTVGGTALYTAFFGGGYLYGTTDFSSFATLFDVARVDRIQILYQPFAKGTSPPSTSTAGVAMHAPFAMVYDPEIAAALTFGAIQIQRDWTDHKNNHFTNTADGIKHVFATPRGEKMVFPSSVGGTSLGMWISCSQYISGVSGGVSVATGSTTAQNSAPVWGVMMVDYVCEFSYRL